MIAHAPFSEVLVALRRRIDLRRLLLRDMWLKGAALGVALLLWLAAIYGAPPADVTLAYGGRVPVERPDVPPGYVLRAQLGDVGVKLRGPEDAVRSIGPQQIRATVDLSALAPSPDPQEVNVVVTVSDQRVHVAEVSPASVSVRLERLTQRVLAVQAQLANSPPSGFRAAPATFRPQEVTVSGPESAVAAVAAVLATVRFGDTAVDLAQDVRPNPVDASGHPVSDVEVDPVSVHVTVPVQSAATTRALPILWQLKGAVAQGYWISRITTDPVAVTVSGDRDVVAGLDHIDSEPVDVSGLTAAKTVSVGLVIPNGVTVLGGADATVTVAVVALSGTRAYPQVAVQVTGLGPGLAADLDLRAVDVVVAGTLPVLAALGAGDVTATIDLSGHLPGSYTVDVAVHTPAGVTIQSVQPARVAVTIRSTRATPTPTPASTP